MLTKAPFDMNAAMKGMMNRTMRKIDGVVWDLTTGVVGIKTKDSIRTLSTDISEPDEQGIVTKTYNIEENLLAMFSYTIPAFAIAKPIELIEPGELIVFKDNNTFGWVVKKHAGSVDVLKGDGTTSNYRPNKVNMIGAGGANTVLVVTSLMGMFPQGQEATGMGNLQSMLLPMLMLGGEGGEVDGLDKMLPILLMSSMGQGQAGQAAGGLMGGMNPMMMAMMMNKGEGGFGDIDPMMLMMMSGGMGGGAAGGMNPMMMLMMMKGKNSPFA